MVDTKRTSADLIANLFQDGQAAGEITEQDLRDFISSLIMPYGGGTMEGNAIETTINTINVFEDIAGTFVEGNIRDMSFNAAGGVLTYTGTPDRHFHIVANLSFITAANNKLIEFQWFKNGSTACGVPVETKVGTGADIGSNSIHGDAVLSTNDTIELKVANETDNTNLTVEDIYVFVMGMFV